MYGDDIVMVMMVMVKIRGGGVGSFYAAATCARVFSLSLAGAMSAQKAL